MRRKWTYRRRSVGGRPLISGEVRELILRMGRENPRSYYGVSLIRHQGVRKALMVFFTLAFVIAGIAGALGAFITKVAPVA